MQRNILFLTILCIIALFVNNSALACKGSQVLFQDDFKTLDPAWGSIAGQPPEGGSIIGLRGDSSEKSQSIWQFSNLKITKP